MNAVNRALPGQQEAALLDYLGRLRQRAAGRQAIHLRISALRPRNRLPERLNIVAMAFEPLINGFDGALFRLHNDDFVVFCKDASPEVVKRTTAHIKNLYSDDPAIKDAAPDRPGFCRQFDLTKALGSVMELAQQASEAARGAAGPLAGGASPGPASAPKQALDPKILGTIQTAIARADLSNVIRRQQVCAVQPGQPPHPVFTEIFTSMAALRDILTPNIDIHGNRWLFQDLTAHLDRRVISYLGHKNDSMLSKAFSLNLNIDCLTSQDFLSLDRRLSGDARRTIVIELQLIDILADLDNFLFSRNFLRERNYRFCLDGLTYQSLPLIDCKRLDVDLVKVIWSPELHEEATRNDGAVRQAVKAVDPRRVILIRCDHELAFETGKALGTTLYQGYLIDKLLKARRAKASA